MITTQIVAMYRLYTRGLTEQELEQVAKTHEYRELTRDEFLKLLNLVDERDRKGRVIVDNAFTEKFLYRLGGVISTVDVYRNSYSNHVRVLQPWPLDPLEHGLIIENMQFPDGQMTGHMAEGKFALLVPRLT